ncbi:Spondin-2 [Eumeta japonica]|uniref:Spondin-2 n=1 Tax=Eumeta variegata TaxID=151549 RepID=A0A4C1W6Z0_EUMVA|nr:Spondin-2 [Eumeta japonica]
MYRYHFSRWVCQREPVNSVARQIVQTRWQTIKFQFDHGVRSIIKAKGMPAELDGTTTALLRAGREHHLVSFVVSILPSPDWFLGVANFELCQAIGEGQWAPEVVLNLYPLDAGTDSGLDFESPNDQTSPKQPITKATFKLIRDKKVKAFARLKVKLVRTYIQQDCVESSQNTTTEKSESDYTESGSEEIIEDPTSSATSSPESTDECDVSEWEDWLPCTGDCIDGQLIGFQTRIRYLVVNGVTLGKYDANLSPRKPAPRIASLHERTLLSVVGGFLAVWRRSMMDSVFFQTSLFSQALQCDGWLATVIGCTTPLHFIAERLLWFQPGSPDESW